jgi:hypothetical protein
VKSDQVTASARIVRDRGNVQFALPPHTTLEIVEHPRAARVPAAPAHAIGLLEWQGRRIALIDAAALVGVAGARTHAVRYALVLAFQCAAGAAIEHGAIALDELPETVDVDDASACDVPAEWRALAISCFACEGTATPIIDTARLFAADRAATSSPRPTTPSPRP